MPAREIVKMTTIEGARVLGLSGKTVSLEVGKYADFVSVSLRAPGMIPIYNIYAALVFTANATDVRGVMIDGKWVVGNGEALSLETARVLHDAAQIAETLSQKTRLIDANDGNVPRARTQLLGSVRAMSY